MTKLTDMSVREAASKTIELLLVSDRWPLKEIQEEFGEDETSLDTDSAWREVKYEGQENSRDGLTAKVVAEYGGEGQGDEYWVVISLSDGVLTRYFRRDGWYASYDGGYLDGDTYEVRPQEKVITVYEKA